MNRKTLIISLIAGLFIALITRASLFVFTTDFSYFQINHNAYPEQIEFNETNNGKQVIGLSGFPFRTYSDCVMDFHGTISSPACNSISWVWEFSIILNTLFWAASFYGISILITKIVKPTHRKVEYSTHQSPAF